MVADFICEQPLRNKAFVSEKHILAFYLNFKKYPFAVLKWIPPHPPILRGSVAVKVSTATQIFHVGGIPLTHCLVRMEGQYATKPFCGVEFQLRLSWPDLVVTLPAAGQYIIHRAVEGSVWARRAGHTSHGAATHNFVL